MAVFNALSKWKIVFLHRGEVLQIFVGKYVGLVVYMIYVWKTSSVKVWYVQRFFELSVGAFWPCLLDFELHMSEEKEFTQKGLIKV